MKNAKIEFNMINEEVNKMMQNYYWGDMFFLIAYSIIFLIIIDRRKADFKSLNLPWYFKFSVLLVFSLAFLDLAENAVMICYFCKFDKICTPWYLFQIIVGLKTVLFIYLTFFFGLWQFPFLYEKFKLWMTTKD